MVLGVCSRDPGREARLGGGGLSQGPLWNRPPVECTELVPCPLLSWDDTMVLAQKQRPQSPHTGTACSLCPDTLEPKGCGQAGLAVISPSGSPSAARGLLCLVTLPHPVGGHRRWSPVAYSLPGGLGVLLSRKGASFWPSLGSHTPGQRFHGMWHCPRHLVWPQTQEHIPANLVHRPQASTHAVLCA